MIFTSGRPSVDSKLTEHFKVLTKDCHTSSIADHISSTGHNIKWDHLEILETGKSDKLETLLIRD